MTNRSQRSQKRFALLLVLPYVLLLIAFGVAPALYALGISFLDTSRPGFNFVGLANYVAAVTDFRFPSALGHVFAFLGLWLPLMVVGVLGLALLLHARPGRLASLMRLLYYLPGSVTGSASVLLWIFMFTPQVSPFGPILRALGLGSLAQTLAAGNLPLAFAVMAFAANAGFWIVVIYGALTTISTEVLEAAKMDGCTPWQLAWRVKTPLVTRYLVLMLILSLAGGFQLFVEPQIINTASLKSLSSSTWSLNQLAYSYAFELGNFSVSAALSIGLLLISLGAALFLIYKTDFYRLDGER